MPWQRIERGIILIAGKLHIGLKQTQLAHDQASKTRTTTQADMCISHDSIVGTMHQVVACDTQELAAYLCVFYFLRSDS